MTLASLHQVLTLRMSPSSRHPRLTPWLPAACAPCSCSLLLPSGEPLALPPSSSPPACAPGHSLHLSGWHKGTRLTCTCAAYARPQGCPRARGACSTSTPQHGPKPHTSYVGSSVASLSGAGRRGTRTGRGGAGAWSAFHIVEVFLAGKAQPAPSSPQLPSVLLHPAGALVPLVHGAGRGSARMAVGTVVVCKLLASVSIALGLARAPFLVRGTWVILLVAPLSGSCRLSACALPSQISSHVSPVCHTSSGSWRHRLQLVGRPREPTPFHAHPPPLCPGPSRVSVVRGCGWH